MAIYIDKEAFNKQYFELSGEKQTLLLPDTFEELLGNQCDPTEFGGRLKWILSVSRVLLANEINLNTAYSKDYITHESNKPNVFLGNIKVDGDFHVDSHTYILGDLEVSGIIYGNIHCILAVAGNVTSSGMLLCRSYLFVLGDINISVCVLAIAYGFIMVEGKIITKAYIQDDTWTTCNVGEDPLDMEGTVFEKIDAEFLFVEDNFEKKEFLDQMVSLFGNDNIKIDEKGSWDFSELFASLSKRKNSDK